MKPGDTVYIRPYTYHNAWKDYPREGTFVRFTGGGEYAVVSLEAVSYPFSLIHVAVNHLVTVDGEDLGLDV